MDISLDTERRETDQVCVPLKYAFFFCLQGFTGGKLLKKIHGTRNTPGDENVSVGSQKHSQVEDKSSTKLHKS